LGRGGCFEKMGKKCGRIVERGGVQKIIGGVALQGIMRGKKVNKEIIAL